MLINNEETAIGILWEFKRMGINISLDDFGTGFSSLYYLKQLPLDEIKIDKTFIQDLETNSDSATITQGIINITNSLGLTVVAEGIETEFQLGFLASLQCNTYQGYLFSKPRPAEEIDALLATHFTAAKTHPAPSRPAVAPAEKRAVLIVDDEPVILNMFKDIFLTKGYVVHTALGGREGLAEFASHHFDVVLLDILMPDMNGLEVLQEMKKMQPSAKIVMITGFSLDAHREQATRDGASLFLNKPIDPAALLSAVDNLLTVH